MKKWFMIFLLVIAFGIAGLVIFKPEPIPPVIKPQNVPDEAVYEGGEDGGNWILCIENPNSVSCCFICTIYNDKGVQLHKGLFVLEGARTSLDTVRSLLGVFTGDAIQLKDHRVLKAVKSRRF